MIITLFLLLLGFFGRCCRSFRAAILLLLLNIPSLLPALEIFQERVHLSHEILVLDGHLSGSGDLVFN